MDIPKAIGAYKLTHTKSGLYYVGSATNLYERYHVHLSTLKSKTHTNPRLQEVFNDDPVFTMEVIVTTTRDEAYDTEQMYLDRYVGRPNCCNVHNSARGGWHTGTAPKVFTDKLARAGQAANRARTYPTGQKHTEESKEKMRAIAAARDPSHYPRGHKRSEEVKAKMRGPRLKRRANAPTITAEQRINLSNAAKKRNTKSKVTVVIDGVTHASVSEAALAIGVTRRTILNRIISPYDCWSGYSYGCQVLYHGTEQAPVNV